MIGFRKEKEVFDWRSVPAVDPDDVARWFGCTDAKDRQFPLQVALQVHDEIESELMSDREMDGMDLAEKRGGLKALRRFATLYAKILAGDKSLGLDQGLGARASKDGDDA